MEKVLKSIYLFYDIFQYQTKFGLKKGPKDLFKGPIIPLIILIAFVAMTGVIVMRYGYLEIWRHDSFHYSPDSSSYEGNLQREGRWINYFLFDLLKPIPGRIAAISNLFFLFLFGFLITRGFIKDVISRLVIGLSLLMIPVFHAQNMWPNITFGAMVFLPFVYYLSKKLPPFIVFGIAAIYYFGTLSNFYFLTPLVYIESLNKSLTGEFKKDLIYFSTKIVIPFALCFIIGFLVANGVVMTKTGNSIVLEEWRRPSPAVDLNQLLINIKRVNERIMVFSSKLFTTVPFLIWVRLLAMFLLSLNKKTIWSILLLLMTFLSAFYSTTYHGILISERTLCVSVIPFILLFCIIPALRFKSNMLHLVLCLALIFPFFNDSSNQIKLFSKITGYYKQQLALVTKNLVPADNYEIVIFIENSEIVSINQNIKNQLGLDFKWGEPLREVNRTISTSLRSLGYYKLFWIRDKKKISDVKAQVQDDTRKDPFVTLSMNNRPNSIGIIINNTTVDPFILDQL